MKIAMSVAEELHRGQTDVLDDLLVLPDRELAQEQAGQGHQEREEDQVVEHPLAHGLAEGVGGDGEDAAQSSGPTSRSCGSSPISLNEIVLQRLPDRLDGEDPSARRLDRGHDRTERTFGDLQPDPLGHRGVQPARPGQMARPPPPGPTPGPPGGRRRAAGSRRGARPPAAVPPAGRPRGRTGSPRPRGCGSRRARSCPPFLQVEDDVPDQPAPEGIEPDIGSSRMTSSGSLTRAWAIPARWTIPFEKRRRGMSAERSKAHQLEQLARARSRRPAAPCRRAGRRSRGTRRRSGSRRDTDARGGSRPYAPRRAPRGLAQDRGAPAIGRRSARSGSSGSWSSRSRLGPGSRRALRRRGKWVRASRPIRLLREKSPTG